MITAQDRKNFADVSIIIKMMSKDMQDKINPKFIKLIEDNKDTKYISYIDNNIPLKKQKLSADTKTLLALIYRDYLCSKDERNNLLIAEKQKLKKLEDETQKKYEIDFEKRRNYPNDEVTNTSLIEYKKETFFTKIKNKIKKFFIFN